MDRRGGGGVFSKYTCHTLSVTTEMEDLYVSRVTFSVQGNPRQTPTGTFGGGGKGGVSGSSPPKINCNQASLLSRQLGSQVEPACTPY